MRTIDGYLSKQAQKVWEGALVYREGEGEQLRFILERRDRDALGIGPNFKEAKMALEALINAEQEA